MLFGDTTLKDEAPGEKVRMGPPALLSLEDA